MNPFPIASVDSHLRPHLQKVLDGEYNIPYLDLQPPDALTILDIGANLGSYSYWAATKWPGCKIFAYEAASATATQYIENMGTCGIASHLTRAAITTNPAPELKLFFGTHNSGEASLDTKLSMQSARYELVPTMHPKLLPEAHILKIDAEGVELEVIPAYLETHETPFLISFEFHDRAHRVALDNILSGEYILGTGQIQHPDLGTLNYYRRDIKL